MSFFPLPSLFFIKPIDTVWENKRATAKMVSSPFLYLQSLVGEGKKIALVDSGGYNYPKAMETASGLLNKCEKQVTGPKQSLSDFLAIKSMKMSCLAPYCPRGMAL